MRFRLGAFTTVNAVLLVLGCSDPSGPGSNGGPASVAIAVTSLSAPSYSVAGAGVAVITCDVGLRARVSGSGSVTWLGATFRWYPGTTGTTPFDTATIAPIDIRDSWGGTVLGGGDTASSSWRFSATIPFTAELEYHYRTSAPSTPISDTVRFVCSPAIPLNPSPVSIGAITVAPIGPEVQAGDTLNISFTATAGAGLWQTLLRIGGACDSVFLFPDTALGTVTHVTQFVVPPGCVLHSNVDIAVAGLDTRLKQAVRTYPPTLTLVDYRPPSLAATGILLPLAGQPSLTLAGNLFVGDLLELLVDATDAQGLAAVYWEVPARAYADSQLVTGPRASGRSSIVLTPQWVGPLDVRLYARDAAGLLSSMVVSAPGALQVYPQVVHRSVTRTFAAEIREVAISAGRGLVYLLHANQQQVEVIDLGTGATVATIALPAIAADMDLTPSGDSLLLVYPPLGAIGVVDLTVPSPVAVTVPVTMPDTTLSQTTVAVRALSNGKLFVSLTGTSPAASRLLVFDPVAGTGSIRSDAGIAGFVEGPMERSDDGTALVLGVGTDHFQRYDVSSDAFGPLRARPVTDARLRVDGTLQHASIGLLTFDGSLLPAGQATSTFGGQFGASTLSADGGILYYVDYAHGLVRTRTSDGALVSATPIKHLTSYLRRSSDDAWMISVESLDGMTSAMSVLDLR